MRVSLSISRLIADLRLTRALYRVPADDLLLWFCFEKEKGYEVRMAVWVLCERSRPYG